RDTELREYARENVINRTLLEQESVRRFGEVPEAEVAARFDALKEEHGGEQAFFDNTGFSRGDGKVILEKLKSSLMVDRLIDAEVTLPETASEEELECHYRENLDRFMGEEEVRVSQIFIEPRSHEAAREAFMSLRNLRRELIAGKDFDEAAREHGSDEDRDIDLGFMKQGQTMPEIEAITFSMEVGEISPIVATHYGFHLFKVTDRKEAAPIPRAEIPGFEERYLSERRASAIADLIDRVKATAQIEEIEETGGVD
ncbi:MAG TPA: peptidylprolyl isomerase, partial [Bacteroidia bacterium]|nr:peptidylprolyl isomerase [Bacteroidia bacterium]